MKRVLHIGLIVLIGTFFSCKVNYSFTGASIPENVKTVSVKTFQSYAPLASANLSETFTEDLKDKSISQTNLDLVTTNGNLQVEG